MEKSHTVIEENKQMSNTKIIQWRFWDSDQRGDESMRESEDIIKEGELQGRRKYSKELKDIKHVEQERRYSFKRVKGRKKEKISH